MYLEEQVFSAISTAATAAGSRVYPDVGPDTPVAPFVIFTRTPSAVENVLSGPPPIENGRFAVDCYAATLLGALNLAAQVQTALLGATAFKALATLEQHVFEDVVKLYRVNTDYSIWTS